MGIDQPDPLLEAAISDFGGRVTAQRLCVLNLYVLLMVLNLIDYIKFQA